MSLLILPRILDQRGNLTFIENNVQIPFKIERTYWIYDVPGGETRGGHAYRENEEFIIALSGSFDVVLDNGKEKQTFYLNRSYYGLYVPKGIWRQMINFSTNSLALILASTTYAENDYIYDYDGFLREQLIVKSDPKDEFQEPRNFEVMREQLIKDSKVDSLKFNNYNLQIKNKSTVYDCTIIELDKHHSDRKGNITVVENNLTVPFEVKRTYYLYDIPGGEERGAHAHKELRQLIIAASGSFDVVLNDGNVKRTFTLNHPYQGLLVVPGIWRELNNFSSGSVCLVLASMPYEEDDYIRDYNEFLEYKMYE